MNALKLEPVDKKFDIGKLKFFIRLVRNHLTRQILEEELRIAQRHPHEIGCGKWATHLEEVLDVLKRHNEEWYRKMFDAMNRTLLDPDVTASDCQQLTLDDLEVEATHLVNTMTRVIRKDFKGGLSDSIRNLLSKNNMESQKMLKHFLYHTNSLQATALKRIT